VLGNGTDAEGGVVEPFGDVLGDSPPASSNSSSLAGAASISSTK